MIKIFPFCLFSLILVLWGCNKEEKCRFDTKNLEKDIMEGSIIELKFICGEHEIYTDPIDNILSDNSTIASVRFYRGHGAGKFYLLAHAPGTTTLRATDNGITVATVTVTVKPQ